MNTKNIIKKATAIGLGLILTLSATTTVFAKGEYEAKIEETRYRFKLADFQSPSFVVGKNIEEITGFGTDYKANNGPDKMINATIEQYKHLNDVSSSNKALKIAFNNQDFSTPAKYTGFKIGPGKLFYSKTILNQNQGIKINANDHGVIFHVELKELAGYSEQEGFAHVTQDGAVTKNLESGIMFVMQERDYFNGKPVPHKTNDGEPQTTALTLGKGDKVTFLWTKSKNVEARHHVLDKDGRYKEDDSGNYIYEEKTIKRKAGEYSIIYSESNSIPLPNGFCGYVIIPFSSMSMIWNGADDDGLINLLYLELTNLYTSVYPEYRGEMWIDELSFYGPTFANVTGAYDYLNPLTGKILGTEFKTEIVGGDVDLNGSINTLDSLSILKYLSKLEELSEQQLIQADCNEDGTVNSLDALDILKVIAQM